MVKDGVNPELLLAGKYGHALHVWNLRTRRHEQTIDLGAEQQMVLELRPAHDPKRAYGFVGVVLSLADLSSSIFLWYLDEHARDAKVEWKAKKVITIPAEPADPALLPPIIQGFGVVPPLVSDINLSVDDKWLYVSCWGTGELRRYDVSDPFDPKLSGSTRIGGIVGRAAHPSAPRESLNGGPQMVEVSRDGKRVYVTNALYSPWDAQFYPDGIRGWMAKFDAPAAGGLALDSSFFVRFEDGVRPHQVRLDGGDASSDSFCFS
jgi:selenium-binding protein 1